MKAKKSKTKSVKPKGGKGKNSKKISKSKIEKNNFSNRPFNKSKGKGGKPNNNRVNGGSNDWNRGPSSSHSSPQFQNQNEKGVNKITRFDGFEPSSNSSKQRNQNGSMEPLKQLIKLEGTKWFDYKVPGVGSNDGENANAGEGVEEHKEVKPIFDTEIKQIETNASKCLDADIEAYSSANLGGDARSDFLWMNKMMKTGTLPDRMAAYTVRIQDSPVHNLHCLQQLVAQVKIQGKQQCLMTAETLKDLFLQDLLPSNRKLVSFADRGTDLRLASKKQLILWLFEDRLKSNYLSFIQALGRMATDTVDKLRGKAISIIQQLLTANPEQESTLLQMLVNKLGDPVHKVGSRALFHLNKLIIAHERMKMVVVEEVERLLFRNNVGKKAQYYGICFLNLVRLENEHPQLAVKLIKVYLAFFKGCVKQGEIDSKLMSALLTGVTKAFPKSQSLGFEFSESVDTLYKIVRLSQFNIGIQALALLLHMTDVKVDAPKADRYYRVLYEKVLSPEVATTAHGMKFLNVIFKAMKADSVLVRVTAFAKRLLQVCHHVPPNIACGILYLLSEVNKTHRGIFKIGDPSKVNVKSSLNRDQEDENGDSQEISKESLVALEKKRKNLETFLKKTNVQVGDTTENSTETVQPQSQPLGGIGKKLHDLAVNKPGKNKKQQQPHPASFKQDLKPQPKPETVDLEVEELEAPIKPENEVTEIKIEGLRTTTYDVLARNPSYCGAGLTLAYELATLAEHYHPSVALFAQTILQSKFVKYDGNPLKDFTVARFLERFIYRNPKTNKVGVRSQYHPQGLRNCPVNSTEYLQTEEASVPIEERFFYKYFKDKKKKVASLKAEGDKEGADDESDIESVGDEEFDDIMSNYFKQTGALASDGEEDDDDDEMDDDEGEDEDDDEIDFAANIKTSKSKKGKSKRAAEEDDESEEDDEDDDGDDDNLEDMEGAYENSDLDDEEAIDADDFIEMSDDDDDLDLDEGGNDGAGDDDDLGLDDDFDAFDDEAELGRKIPKMAKSKSKLKGLGKDKMFVPAEEFADMLDSNADLDLTGSHTLINKDNSDMKQLTWESERDRWMKGYKKTSRINFKSQKSKKRKYN